MADPTQFADEEVLDFDEEQEQQVCKNKGTVRCHGWPREGRTAGRFASVARDVSPTRHSRIIPDLTSTLYP